MTGFFSRQIREFTASIENLGRRLLVMAILAVVALLFLLGALAFLSVALYLAVAARESALVAALAVAGFYLLVAIICFIILGIRTRRAKPAKAAAKGAENPATQDRAAFSANVDQTLGPLIAALHESNLKPEEFAVRLGANLTKEVGPLGLVGLAVAAGFLFAGRMTGSKKI